MKYFNKYILTVLILLIIVPLVVLGIGGSKRIIGLPGFATDVLLFVNSSNELDDSAITIGGSDDILGVGDGTAAAPSYSFNTDLTTGMYSSSADVIEFATDGNKGAAFTKSTGGFLNFGTGTSGYQTSDSLAWYLARSQATATGITINNASASAGADARVDLQVNSSPQVTGQIRVSSSSYGVAPFAGKLTLYNISGNGIGLFAADTGGVINHYLEGASATNEGQRFGLTNVTFDADGTISPDSTLSFEVTGTTTKSSKPAPTLTTTQRDAITTPASGSMVYNSTKNKYDIYNGSSWQEIQSGGVGGNAWTYTAKTTTYTAVINDFINSDSSSGAFTVTLPTAVSIAGAVIAIRKSESSANAVTVDGDGTETINGYLSLDLSSENDTVYISSDGANWMIISSHIEPTTQKFTSGSGTYTTALGVKYIRVRMVGGGAGGGGGGTASAGVGGAGGNTTFGTSLLVANGGSGLTGGTASLGSGPEGLGNSGGAGFYGQNANGTNIFLIGPSGGSSALGGGGPGGFAGAVAGIAAVANSGGGGGGGGGTGGTGGFSGDSGASGGFVNARIKSPSATYSYAVGAAGSAGSAGTSGGAGGAGGSGIIEVTEFY